MILGTLCAAIVGAGWIFGLALWQEIDSRDRGKCLRRKFSTAAGGRIPWVSRNGERENLPEAKAEEENHPSAKSASAGNSEAEFV